MPISTSLAYIFCEKLRSLGVICSNICGIQTELSKTCWKIFSFHMVTF